MEAYYGISSDIVYFSWRSIIYKAKTERSSKTGQSKVHEVTDSGERRKNKKKMYISSGHGMPNTTGTMCFYKKPVQTEH